ncbi:MAG: UpxY family transcription antiterminator [Acidobacteriia bacterium]|nr:UpxY family transcription antiterminator [Terriglobia bacterium]
MIKTIPSASLSEQQRVTTESQMFWYAAYTSSRHEKTVAEHLRQREVECFLPLYETVRRWNNGRHRVQLPLFPSYVFVRMGLRDKLRVLQVPGLSQLVTFQGSPAVLPDSEIESLRNALTAGIPAQPYRYLTVGSHVEICNGPLQGMKGILLRHQGQFRVVLSVEMIMRSIVVEVEASDVVALDRKDSRLVLASPREAERIAAASA